MYVICIGLAGSDLHKKKNQNSQPYKRLRRRFVKNQGLTKRLISVATVDKQKGTTTISNEAKSQHGTAGEAKRRYVCGWLSVTSVCVNKLQEALLGMPMWTEKWGRQLYYSTNRLGKLATRLDFQTVGNLRPSVRMGLLRLLKSILWFSSNGEPWNLLVTAG